MTDKPKLTFTLDLEDHRPDDHHPKRYHIITEKILDFLKHQNIKATIFIVGELAEKEPNLIKDIHNLGHEIAHHSYNHTILTKQAPDEFRDHTKRAKDILEDITGAPVKGYRAPVFSLTRTSLWAVDILKDLGFEYSSSVLPARNPLHGLPHVPNTPFRWSNGLLEIPAPTANIYGVNLPYLGGFYLRYLPMALIKSVLQKADKKSRLWTYCHPYDFDHEEKNWRIKDASIAISILLKLNRKNTFKKMERLLRHVDINSPFKDQKFSAHLPVIDPATIQQDIK